MQYAQGHGGKAPGLCVGPGVTDGVVFLLSCHGRCERSVLHGVRDPDNRRLSRRWDVYQGVQELQQCLREEAFKYQKLGFIQYLPYSTFVTCVSRFNPQNNLKVFFVCFCFVF